MIWFAMGFFVLAAVLFIIAMTVSPYGPFGPMFAGLAAIFFVVSVGLFISAASAIGEQNKIEKKEHDKHLCSLISNTTWIDEANLCLADGKTVIKF